MTLFSLGNCAGKIASLYFWDLRPQIYVKSSKFGQSYRIFQLILKFTNVSSLKFPNSVSKPIYSMILSSLTAYLDLKIGNILWIIVALKIINYVSDTLLIIRMVDWTKSSPPPFLENRNDKRSIHKEILPIFFF